MNHVSTFEAIRRWTDLNHELVLSAVAKNNLPCLEQALEQTTNPWRAGDPGPKTETESDVAEVRKLAASDRAAAVKLVKKRFNTDLLDALHVVRGVVGGGPVEDGISAKAAQILSWHFNVHIPWHETREGVAHVEAKRELLQANETIRELQVMVQRSRDEISAKDEAIRIWKKGSDERVEAMRKLNNRIENLMNEVHQGSVQVHTLQKAYNTAVELLKRAKPFVDAGDLVAKGDDDRKKVARAVFDFLLNYH